MWGIIKIVVEKHIVRDPSQGLGTSVNINKSGLYLKRASSQDPNSPWLCQKGFDAQGEDVAGMDGELLMHWGYDQQTHIDLNRTVGQANE